MGDEERSDGVEIFLAEKWVDSVVSVERHSKKSTDFDNVFRHTHTHTCRPVDGTSMNEECEAVKTTL